METRLRDRVVSNFLRTPSASIFSSCSQILITFQPIPRSVRPTLRSRFRFPSILAIQKARLVVGMERHRRHPCQKQPSKKIARRLRGKKTSGAPGISELCPSAQPLIADRIRRDRNLHSVVFVPRDLFRLITRERVTLLNVSNQIQSRLVANNTVSRRAVA